MKLKDVSVHVSKHLGMVGDKHLKTLVVYWPQKPFEVLTCVVSQISFAEENPASRVPVPEMFPLNGKDEGKCQIPYTSSSGLW